MGNFFKNEPKILKLIVKSSYISYINMHLEKKLLIWKLDFLRIFFWRFIEVKRTILVE